MRLLLDTHIWVWSALDPAASESGWPRNWVRQALRKKPLFREASFNHEVGVESHRVELPHWDPGDRILAATALVHDLTLVTADERLLGLKSISVLASR